MWQPATDGRYYCKTVGIIWVKQSLYRPVTDLGGSSRLRHSTHEGGKVVSPTHRPPLPPGTISGTQFC